MNIQHVRVLARYELVQSLRSARGILFLALYGILWFWALWKLADGRAVWLAKPEGNALASWLLDAEVARALFLNNPPTLSAFFLLALGMIPIFTMWGAGDQTASDIGTRHLRFLIPRCGRYEIYLGRFLGAVAFLLLVHALLAAAGAVVSLVADDLAAGRVFSYGLRVLLAMLAYTLPYVALMAFIGALTGSAVVAVLTAISAYVVIGLIASLMSMNWEAARHIEWLTPAPLKGVLLTGDTGPFLLALLALAVYCVVYFVIGWLVFRRRDI